jgi:hypothetical protein
VYSSKELLLSNTSNTKEIKKSNTNTSNTSTKLKNRSNVQRIANYLQELLKPERDNTLLYMKYAWAYEEGLLIRLANEAIERDKYGNPAKFFNYLVRAELGYKKT